MVKARRGGAKKSSVNKKKINWKVLILCLVFVFVAAGIGSLLTSSNVDTQWYYLIKPNIAPPNWVFPVIWNALFVMIAYSIYFAWIKLGSEKKKRSSLIILFTVNLLLNILWSFIFFYQMNPLGAFIELIFLWISTLFLIIWLWKLEKKSSYLLIPYLLWMLFAAWINWQAYLNSVLVG